MPFSSPPRFDDTTDKLPSQLDIYQFLVALKPEVVPGSLCPASFTHGSSRVPPAVTVPWDLRRDSRTPPSTTYARALVVPCHRPEMLRFMKSTFPSSVLECHRWRVTSIQPPTYIWPRERRLDRRHKLDCSVFASLSMTVSAILKIFPSVLAAGLLWKIIRSFLVSHPLDKIPGPPAASTIAGACLVCRTFRRRMYRLTVDYWGRTFRELSSDVQP